MMKARLSALPTAAAKSLEPHGRRREDEARGAPDRRAYFDVMGERTPDTDTGEPETSSDALLDELVRALAREFAERDHAALRTKPRRTRRPAGGTKDSR
jgi:hypothetical protein